MCLDQIQCPPPPLHFFRTTLTTLPSQLHVLFIYFIFFLMATQFTWCCQYGHRYRTNIILKLHIFQLCFLKSHYRIFNNFLPKYFFDDFT